MSGLHVKYRLVLSDFNENSIFPDGFSKNPRNVEFHENPLSDFNENSIFPDGFSKNPRNVEFHETRTVGAELFHAGGRTNKRTDMTKLMVAFRNFTNALNLLTAWENYSGKLN